MEKNLGYYVKVYDNWLDESICDQTVKQLENLNWKQHLFYTADTTTAEAKNGEKELEVSYDTITSKQIIMKRIWDGYYKYLQDLNFSWFYGWQGFTEVRFNRYLENRSMLKHCDHITTVFDGDRKGIPTMSALGLLNDNFEGGEFVMFDNDKIELKKGSLMIFPSCFLFPHRVESVNKGVRYSFISWAW